MKKSVLTWAQLGGGGGISYPSDISDLNFWWDMAEVKDPRDGTTDTMYRNQARTAAVTSDAEPVGSVTDLAGNGYHLGQTVNGNRPIWNTSQINGLGGADWLRSSSKYMTTDSFSQTFPATWVIVFNIRTAGSGSLYYFYSPTQHRNSRYVGTSDVITLQDNGQISSSATGFLSGGEDHWLMYYHHSSNAADSEIYLDGTLIGNGTSIAEYTTLVDLNVGCDNVPGNFFDGDFYEFFGWDGDKRSRKSDIAGYISNKYGI